eukprot:TRINITY_DN14640_c0_g1_i1.p1 TRINITY_DN14640_c0_g1~~TRINITY_DN14640_c0_g1_i1.p1  ORF type:complete len:432 (+),score=87.82 TRINITY_DN14640_c0_g1_i1:84-1298(+)
MAAAAAGSSASHGVCASATSQSSTPERGRRPLPPGNPRAAARRSMSAGSYFDLARQLPGNVIQDIHKSIDFGKLLLRKKEQQCLAHHRKERRLELELQKCAQRAEGDADLNRREVRQLEAQLLQARRERRELECERLILVEELSEQKEENRTLRQQLQEVRIHRAQMAAPRSPQSSLRSRASSLLRTPTPARAMPRGFTHTPTFEGSTPTGSRSARRRLADCTSARVQTSPQETRAGAWAPFYGQAVVAPGSRTSLASAGAGRSALGVPDGETDRGAGTPSVSGEASPRFRRAPLAATPPPSSSGSTLSVQWPTLAEELSRAEVRDTLISDERVARGVLAGREQAQRAAMGRRAPTGSAALRPEQADSAASPRERNLQRLREELRFLQHLREGIFGQDSGSLPR